MIIDIHTDVPVYTCSVQYVYDVPVKSGHILTNLEKNPKFVIVIIITGIRPK